MSQDLKLEKSLEMQEVLHQHNAYVRDFKSVMQRAGTDDVRLVIRADRTPVGEHSRRYNRPTTKKVGFLMMGQDFEKRDVVFKKQEWSP